MVPLTIISGYLGAGKTTLLRNLLERTEKKLALIINEFGELGIDGKIIKGKNANMVELLNGCVCCSLTGEFKQAVSEILENYRVDHIIVETTGIAEPEALALNVEEIENVELRKIIAIVDASSFLKFPIGMVGKMQIKEANLILLNKIDIADKSEIGKIEKELREINSDAEIIKVVRCNIPEEKVLE